MHIFTDLSYDYVEKSEVKKMFDLGSEKQMKFMQIAMKYMPEAKEFFEQNNIELSMDQMMPMAELLMKVMNEAYDLGKANSEE